MHGNERFLTRDFELDHLHRLETYEARGGYRAAYKALKTMTPGEVLDQVKAANLRGRGGAGFPAGVKWGFVPRESDAPKYLMIQSLSPLGSQMQAFRFVPSDT